MRLEMMLSTLIVLLFGTASAVHKAFTTTSSDAYAVLIAKTFGMASRGLVTVDYSISAQNESLPYSSYATFLLVEETQRDSWYGTLTTKEKTFSLPSTMCTQPSIFRKQVYGSGAFTYEIDPDYGADQYTLIFIQCMPSTSTNPINVHIEAQMKNARPYSSKYSHLSIDEVLIPRILEGEALIYTLLILGLSGQIYFGKNYATPLHFVFLFTLVCSYALVFAEYYDFWYYNEHGVDHEPMIMAINVISAFNDTAVLTSLLLLSLGWALVRETLQDKERRLVIWSILTFFIFTMGAAGCTPSDSETCKALSLLSFILKSILLLAIIIAMNFTVTQLRQMLHHSPWVPSTPLQYARSQQFQNFRLVFLLYLLLPTAFSLVQITLYSWKETWLVFLLNELLTIFMFVHVGVNFSPMYEVLLMRPFDGSLNAGTGAPHLRAE